MSKSGCGIWQGRVDLAIAAEAWGGQNFRIVGLADQQGRAYTPTSAQPPGPVTWASPESERAFFTWSGPPLDRGYITTIIVAAKPGIVGSIGPDRVSVTGEVWGSQVCTPGNG